MSSGSVRTRRTTSSPVRSIASMLASHSLRSGRSRPVTAITPNRCWTGAFAVAKITAVAVQQRAGPRVVLRVRMNPPEEPMIAHRDVTPYGRQNGEVLAIGTRILLHREDTHGRPRWRMGRTARPGCVLPRGRTERASQGTCGPGKSLGRAEHELAWQKPCLHNRRCFRP
jgi:hypothetical protein